MSESNGMAQGTPTEDPRLVVLGYVAGAVKHLTGCTREQAVQSAEHALGEVEALNEVIQGGGDATNPTWGVNFATEAGKGTVGITKLIAAKTDEEKIQSLLVLGIVTSPIARAAAYALGFHVSFFQARPAPKSRIILP